jgi:uroporphyrinogen decarboxylase
MNKPLLRILRKEPSEIVPIWFMRQAGRYLPEYREVRKKFSNFLDFCQNSEAAAEVTIQPLKRFDLNAAILFSDILVIPFAMGMKVEFEEKRGPVLGRIESPTDINKYQEINIKVFENITKTVSILSNELNKDFNKTALIGFAGSPWTIAAYMIEGSGSKDFAMARNFAYLHEKDFQKLIDNITQATIKYLEMQIEAGAEVKLFDSWAGVLAEKEFKKWVVKPTELIVSYLNRKFPKIPIIGFPRKAGVMYKDYVHHTGVDAVALDQTIPIEWANTNLPNVAIQGNLDNILLLGDEDIVKKQTGNFVKEIDRSRTIVNLGHGILPETKIDNVKAVIDTIREYGSQKTGSGNKS